MKMNDTIKLGIVLVLVIIFAIGLYVVITRLSKKACIAEMPNPQILTKYSQELEVVPTMKDTISGDTTWCGTFQLVWNDVLKELAGQAIEFTEPLEMVDNLNAQDFNEQSLSEDYYYKKFGLKTLDLKQEIERGIQEKFHETSDILNDIDWSEEAQDGATEEFSRYLFYAMLKRDFSYEQEFTKLENGKFANFENVAYFGIDDSTEKPVRKQVDVLYYDSREAFAVVLNTVEGDQVILCKGIQGTTFEEIYQKMLEKSENYAGNKSFSDTDYLQIPEIDFSVKKEYEELENKNFFTNRGTIAEITKALQMIQLKMDQKGGSIKSEAVMDVVDFAIQIPEEAEPRYFLFNSAYTLFLQENGKPKPYFAAQISDITKFQ